MGGAPFAAIDGEVLFTIVFNLGDSFTTGLKRITFDTEKSRLKNQDMQDIEIAKWASGSIMKK